jgi:teichuronic acid biosynthesis glycosyltransferase TuaH
VAGTEDLLDAVPTRQRLFYATDDFVAGAGLMGTDAAWLARRQRRQLELADTVVAISPALRDGWAESRPDIHMIPNGCEPEHYAGVDALPAPDDIRLPRPIAGFVGHMSERIDLAMLEAVAATGTSLLLVGPRQSTFEIARMDALLARPNVRWVGPKAFAELPPYLGAIDVGVTPYQRSDFNRASFPLKTLEYLAAGRPAVVSDLPAHRWLDTPHVSIAGSPEAFAARVLEVLAMPPDPAAAAERRAIATHHSWTARTAEIAALLGLAPQRSADAA